MQPLRETHLLNTGQQCAELIERIDEDNIFIHFDTYHMNIEEHDFAEAIIQAGSHCRYIHLSESGRSIPGQGTVDWDSIFRGLVAPIEGLLLQAAMVIYGLRILMTVESIRGCFSDSF